MSPANAMCVEYGEHAIERYGVRVRSAALPAAIEHELRAVVACAGQIVAIPPAWAPWDVNDSAYLTIGEDIVFPLVVGPDGLIAKTCLIRAWCPPSVRRARKARRRARRNRHGHDETSQG
jgi:hypothetical protein